MRELNLNEVEQVNGGALPLIPVWAMYAGGGFGLGFLGAWIVS